MDTRGLEILALYMEIPGSIPSIEAIAEHLNLKLETAKRYERRFRQSLRQIPEFIAMHQGFLGTPEPQPVVVVAQPKVIQIAAWKRQKLSVAAPEANTLGDRAKVIPLFYLMAFLL